MVIGNRPVVAVTDDCWRRALIRAVARGYTVELVRETVTAGFRVRVFRVSSNSEPGTWRHVGLSRLDAGYSASCDCPAGQHERPCVHVALVLREVGVLPDPQPLVIAA